MQNLKKCPNWYITVPRKLFSSPCNYSTTGLSCGNLKCITLKSKNDVNKLLFRAVPYHVYNQIFKEVRIIKSLVFPSSVNHISTLSPRGQHIRNFSTSNKNNNGKESSKEGSNDSNKGSKKDDDEKIKVLCGKLLLFGITTYILSITIRSFTEMTPENVSWNEFVHHMLAKGEVEKIIIKPEFNYALIVLHSGAVIKGERFRFKKCIMTLPNAENFEQRLRITEQNLGIKPEHSVPVIYEHSDAREGITSLILSGILIYLLYRMRGKIANPAQFFTQMTRAKFTLVDPLTGPGKGVRFEDVAGLKEAKIEVMEFVDYLKHPEHYKVLGAKVPKGALLLGPPGCGKTLLAKAVATEANVPFLSMNGSEFIEMYGGLGAARVRDLFKEGRKRAPSILYIDEIDALGKKRSDSGQAGWGTSETEQTLNQLLVEMDGIVSTEGVIVLASTNRAEVLDKALLRPGRFDRHILIDLPTLEERKQIFEQHLKSVVLDHEPSTYSSKLAYLTPGFSGADIANVCNEAALHAARTKKKKVDGSDLAYAIDRTVAGPEKKDHAMSPAEKRVVAYHESGHALVGWLLEHTDALLKVTIVPRTSRALGFAQYIPTDQKLYSKEEMFDRMCMMLGGRVAESVTFNKITTGAQNDLTKVTKMAYAQVQQYGMSPTVGLVSFDEEHTSSKNRKPYSRAFGNLMDIEARNIIAKAHKRTEKLLVENRHKLNLLAETLFKKETLTYDDVVQLIGPPPFEKKRLLDPGDLDAPFKKAEVHTTTPKTEVA